MDLILQDSLLVRRATLPNTETEERENQTPLRQTRSLNSSPKSTFREGIPLGSLTARLASKSFWNSEMLKTSMEQISQCAIQEVSCLGSSVESFKDSEDEDYDRDLIRVSEDEHETSLEESGAGSNSDGPEDDHGLVLEQLRELRNPLFRLPPRGSSGMGGYRTPPYLSPGITRRVLQPSGLKNSQSCRNAVTDL